MKVTKQRRKRKRGAKENHFPAYTTYLGSKSCLLTTGYTDSSRKQNNIKEFQEIDT